MRTAHTADDADIREAMKSVQGTWKLWLLVLLVAGLGGYGVYHLRTEIDATKLAMAESDARATKKQAELLAAKDIRTGLENRISELEKANAALAAFEAKYNADQQSKQSSFEKLQSLSSTISILLANEISAKEVEVVVVGEELVVDIAGKVLFDVPEPILSKRGEELITKLLTAFSGLSEKQVVEVRAHTDSSNVPEKLKPIAPTAWELSSMQAAAFARKLLEQTKWKEERVLVSGAAASRPRPKERARSRRIELRIGLPRS